VKETLALNVDSVRIVGAAGEPEFGSPRVLDTHSDINEWMDGLRAGDGSGCVPSFLTSLTRSNVIQKCLEVEERKGIGQRAGRKLCHRDGHCPRTTWILVRTTDGCHPIREPHHAVRSQSAGRPGWLARG